MNAASKKIEKNRADLAALKALYKQKQEKASITAQVDYDDELTFGKDEDGNDGSYRGDPLTMMTRDKAEERDAAGEVGLGDKGKEYFARIKDSECATALIDEAAQELRDHRTYAETFRDATNLYVSGAALVAMIASQVEQADGLEGTDRMLRDVQGQLEALMQCCSKLAFRELRGRQRRRLYKLDQIREPAPDLLWSDAVNSWLQQFDGAKTTDDTYRWEDWVYEDAKGWKGAASDLEVRDSLENIYAAVLHCWLAIEDMRRPGLTADSLMGFVRYPDATNRWTSFTRLEEAYEAWLRNVEDYKQAQDAKKAQARSARQRAFGSFLRGVA